MTSGYRVPGTRIGAERLRDLPAVGAAGAWLFGPAAWLAWTRARLGHARSAERSWSRLAARVLRMRIEIIGLDHIDTSERYVVAPLHEGYADVVALLHLPLDMRFVARTEFLGWSRLGPALRAGGHLGVEPEQPVSAYRALRRWSGKVLESESLVVFPQGTLLGVESLFSRGAFQLADSEHRPLLPVVITGTHRVWEHPFSPVVRFNQSVRVEIMPPLPAGSATADMRGIEREMKRRALEAIPQPRRYVPERDGWWDGYQFEIDPDFHDLAAQVEAHQAAVRRISA